MYGESEEECINLTKRLFAFKLSTVVTEWPTSQKYDSNSAQSTVPLRVRVNAHNFKNEFVLSSYQVSGVKHQRPRLSRIRD